MIGTIVYLAIVLAILAVAAQADRRASQEQKAFREARIARQQRLYEQTFAALQPYVEAGREAEKALRDDGAVMPEVTTTA